MYGKVITYNTKFSKTLDQNLGFFVFSSKWIRGRSASLDHFKNLKSGGVQDEHTGGNRVSKSDSSGKATTIY
jgi:hypothetical protein